MEILDLKNKDTVELFTDLFLISQEIENRRIEAKERLSYLDLEVSNIYHDIETNAFNAREGYKLAKKLQKILQYRRVVKRDISMFVYLQSESSKIAWKKFFNDLNGLKKVTLFTEKSRYQNDEWSNYKKLGKVEYQEVVQFCDKQFGDTGEVMSKLSSLIETKSKESQEKSKKRERVS